MSIWSLQILNHVLSCGNESVARKVETSPNDLKTLNADFLQDRDNPIAWLYRPAITAQCQHA
jgi:hypothetical protein